MAVVAYLVLAIAAVYIILGPLLIGRPKQGTHHEAWEYIVSLVASLLHILLCGRVLGWW